MHRIRMALFSSTVISRSIRSVTAAASTPFANAFCRSQHRLVNPNIPNLIICSSTASSDALKKVDRKLTQPQGPKVTADLPLEIEDDPEGPIIDFKREFRREKNVEGGGHPVSYHYNPREYHADDADDGGDADGNGDGGSADGGGADCGGGGGDCGGGGGDCGGF